MISAVLWLFNTVIGLYIIVVLAMMVMSWLIAFNVVNTRHPFVAQLDLFLHAMTDPALRPIRRIVPRSEEHTSELQSP